MSGSKFSTSPRHGDLRRRLPARIRPGLAAILHLGRRARDPGRRLHLGRIRPPDQLRAGQRVGQPGQSLDIDGAQEFRRDPGCRPPAPTPTPSCSRPRAPPSTSSGICWRAAVQSGHQRGDASGVAANKYLSEQEPWKLADDPERQDAVLHTALQVVDDANTLLTPFLPHSAQKVFQALGGTGCVGGPAGDRRGRPDDVEDRSRAGLPGPDRRLHRASRRAGRPSPIQVGRPLAKPTPLFAKLDPELGETGPAWAPIRSERPGAGTRVPLSGADGRASGRPPGPLPPPPSTRTPTSTPAAASTPPTWRAAWTGRPPWASPRSSRSPTTSRPPAGSCRRRSWDDRVVRRRRAAPDPRRRPRRADHAEIERLAARPAGGRGGGDRPGPLLAMTARRAGAAGGLRLAHRPRQAHRQTADDPRPRRP